MNTETYVPKIIQCSFIKCLSTGYFRHTLKIRSFSGGANNPFLQETYTADGRRIEGNQGQNQQYYGSGYSQAQSGYSSSGLGNQKYPLFKIKGRKINKHINLQVYNEFKEPWYKKRLLGISG